MFKFKSKAKTKSNICYDCPNDATNGYDGSIQQVHGIKKVRRCVTCHERHVRQSTIDLVNPRQLKPKSDYL